MLNKIYLILFAVAILLMAVLSYLTVSQLNSIGFPPPQIVEYFRSFESLHWLSLWISSLALLILANVILWTNRTSWALWITLLFFGVFIMVNTWWLTENLGSYQKVHNLETGGMLSKNGIFGAILCIVGGIGIFFNQYIVLRMRDKMFDKPSEVVEEKTEITEKQTENQTEENATEEPSIEESKGD